jgi:hypothetical protein
MNPYLPLAILVALLLTGTGGFFYGGHVREAEITAREAKEKEIRQQTRDDAREGAADAISKIEVKNVVVNQKLQTEIREKPVYRDCVNTPGGLQLINEALTGQPQPADNSKLPGTAATE